jgi:hypothetical protein
MFAASSLRELFAQLSRLLDTTPPPASFQQQRNLLVTDVADFACRFWNLTQTVGAVLAL